MTPRPERRKPRNGNRGERNLVAGKENNRAVLAPIVSIQPGVGFMAVRQPVGASMACP
jgi:hypothetical protein